MAAPAAPPPAAVASGSLYVGDLDKDVTESQLFELFNQVRAAYSPAAVAHWPAGGHDLQANAAGAQHTRSLAHPAGCLLGRLASACGAARLVAALRAAARPAFLGGG
jgi:hypothetical protein